MFTGFFWVIWDCIQIIARALPHGTLSQIQKQQFINLIKSFAPLIPCPGCAFHAIEYIQQHPLNPQTGQEAFEYIITFHNEVNLRNGKPTFTPAEAEAAMEQRLARDYKDMPRGIAMQKEANAKVLALQKELAQIKDIRFAATNQSIQIWVIVGMVIAVLTFLLVLLFALLLWKRMTSILSVLQTVAPVH